MKMKNNIQKLQALKGENFARVIVREQQKFPYKSCEIMRGAYDDDENFTEDGKFHVVCSDYEIPPNTVREEVFETAEDVFEKFLVNGKPLSEFIENIDDSQIIIDA